GTRGSLVLRALDPEVSALPYARLTAVGAMSGPVDVRIVTQLWGLTTPITRPVLAAYPPPAAGSLPPAPTLSDTLVAYPFMVEDGGPGRWLSIPEGTHDITGSLVLPEGYGLRIAPGVTLRFTPEAYLLARGPLVFQGTDTAPVVLQPVEDRWRGIVVIDAGSPSVWTNVTVEDTIAIDMPGWTLTGGITFYQSPIRLSQCRILGTEAEDAINTIRTEFAFVETEVANTVSDAFDADFSTGTVASCSFHDIGGDAIDVSGSQVTVDGVRALRVGDKGVSAGEASQATVRGLSVDGADFGIVSKDMSHVIVESATVTGVRVAGLAAYIKKPEYGAATMAANGITFADVPAERIALVQTGSWIDLEGIRIWGANIDVDALYDR
ncbi:MAG: right-handed parallel beta-helix repeat-containing protein, partial [Anaerolineae bacterium]|nr:right-handed parallel beta-helix repeat-containing protein [Anaerolineae bacterium]